MILFSTQECQVVRIILPSCIVTHKHLKTRNVHERCCTQLTTLLTVIKARQKYFTLVRFLSCKVYYRLVFIFNLINCVRVVSVVWTTGNQHKLIWICLFYIEVFNEQVLWKLETKFWTNQNIDIYSNKVNRLIMNCLNEIKI